MNHNPYRGWLLQDEPLSPEDQAALDQHLASCTECRQILAAWQGLQAELQQAPSLKAPAGFSDRFQASLAGRKHAWARRQAWLVLGASLALGLILMGLMLPLLFSNLAASVTGLMEGFISAAVGLAFLRDLVGSLLSVVPAPVNSLAGASLVVAVAGLAWAAYASLGGLWAAVVYRFAISKNGGTR